MLNLLAEEGSGNGIPSWIMWPVLGVVIVLIVVWMILSSKKRKKQEKEAQDLIDAVKPGNKVKTIGGICGIVVEVDKEENTFVLETGTETSGKCYIKFDKQAIYQTDAVVEKEKPAEEGAAETPANEEASEAPSEEANAPAVEEEKTPDVEAPAKEAKPEEK